jgi:hypothetical protein
MTTYTVLNRHGDVQERGLTASQAADVILSYDGHRYDVRQSTDNKWLDLWVSQFSQNSPLGGRPLVRSGIFGSTEDEIWSSVLTHADYWSSQSCMLDTDYDVLAQSE